MSSTLTNLLIHVVFSTKGREPILSGEYRERIHSYIGGIIRSEGAEPLCNIENQTEHHRKKTFDEELVEILEKHGVDFDPKYLWD